MYPLRSQENADEASPAGPFPTACCISVPFLVILPPPLLGKPRELGITDGSFKPPFMQTASRRPQSAAPLELAAALGLRTVVPTQGTVAS